MSKKKEEVQIKKEMENMFKVDIQINNNEIIIFDDKFHMLVKLNQGQVRSIINIIDSLIAEDIPAMIKNSDWNKESWNIKINCELPLKDMLDK